MPEKTTSDESQSNLRSVLKGALRSKVRVNASYLYIIQIIDVLPLFFTIPYLVRVLRPDGFGLVSFAQSLITYFILFIDYGFLFSATRKIAKTREDRSLVNQTVFKVWAAKALLALLGFFVLLILLLVIPRLQQQASLFLILFGMVLGAVLFPLWLFQGMEEMRAITFINTSVRVLSTVAIFLLVHQPGDYLLYAAILSGSQLLVGIAGAVVGIGYFKLTPHWPSLPGVWQELKEGWVVFLSMASANLYANGNAFLLGLFASNTVVGYYSSAEKLVRATLIAITPLMQAAYPAFNRLVAQSKKQALQMARTFLLVIGIAGLGIALFLFFFAPPIVRLVFGSSYEPAIPLIRVMSLMPFFVAISNVLGVQILLPFGQDKAFMRILLGAVLVDLILALLLIPPFGAMGICVAFLSTEAFAAGAMFWQVYRTLFRTQ